MFVCSDLQHTASVYGARTEGSFPIKKKRLEIQPRVDLLTLSKLRPFSRPYAHIFKSNFSKGDGDMPRCRRCSV